MNKIKIEAFIWRHRVKAKVKLLLAGFLLLAVSCKKYQAGCTDPTADNFSSYAKLDDGSCMYTLSQNFSTDIWQFNDPDQEAYFLWSEITQDVIDNGSFTAYVLAGSEWIELPWTFYNSSSYSSTLTAAFYLGGFTIYWRDSDLINPGYPGLLTFKVVLTK